MKTIVKEITVGYSFKPEMGCFGFSSCLLVESNKRILFDVGGYNIRSLIKPLINEIDCVVISHLHFDHCSNLDLFVDTNIPIYISRKELDYYEKYKDIDTDLFSYFELIRDRLNIVEVQEEIEIDKGIRILFTNGHTPGHMSLVIEKENTILSGDALKTYKDYLNVNDYGNAYSKEDYVSSKKKIIDNFSVIYPGHSGKIVNGKLERRMEVREF